TPARSDGSTQTPKMARGPKLRGGGSARSHAAGLTPSRPLAESRSGPGRRARSAPRRSRMKRVAVFGWGLVAPGAANISEFEQMLRTADTHLEPFAGFGRGPFLVGHPKFDFADYEPWLATRFPPSRARPLREKVDETSRFSIGAFIQALGQNPALEGLLRELRQEAHVYVGNALGALPTIYKTSVDLYRAQRRWNRFWSDPARNAALRAHLESPAGDAATPPAAPATVT